MAHIYSFKPPLHANNSGSFLRLAPLPDNPTRALSDSRLGELETPYRSNPALLNILDRITLGSNPRSLDQALILFMCGIGISGLSISHPAIVFRFNNAHIHKTEEPMRPDVLISHSTLEGVGPIAITAVDELAIFIATLFRELGHASYLSTVYSPEGTPTSGLFFPNNPSNFVIHGKHPCVSSLVIFEDSEVLEVLDLLRIYNDLKRLRRDLFIGIPPGQLTGTYTSLIANFAAMGIQHHARSILEDEITKLGYDNPLLLSGMGQS